MTAPAPILSVQYLRGIAAMLVVLHHTHGELEWLFDPLRGIHAPSAGVDIFFVISGFIMYTTARSASAGQFFKRRLVRIAPLYWAVTLILAGLVLLTGRTNTVVSPENIAQSLLFIPQYSEAFPGQIKPMLAVGWTLEYEMFFYALFAVGLMVKRPLIFATVAILGLVGLGLIIQPDGAILKTYTAPLMLEFVAGMWVAKAYAEGGVPRWLWIIVPPAAALLLSSDFWPLPWSIERAAPAVLIVAGSLALEGRFQRNAPLAVLGDASYSLYLSHPLTLLFVQSAFKRLPLEGWPQFLSLMVVGIVASTVVGLLTYRYVEQPLLAMFRSRSLRARTA